MYFLIVPFNKVSSHGAPTGNQEEPENRYRMLRVEVSNTQTTDPKPSRATHSSLGLGRQASAHISLQSTAWWTLGHLGAVQDVPPHVHNHLPHGTALAPAQVQGSDVAAQHTDTSLMSEKTEGEAGHTFIPPISQAPDPVSNIPPVPRCSSDHHLHTSPDTSSLWSPAAWRPARHPSR